MATPQYRSKELSWLSFNERLLQEANKPEVPVIERIKFLGIYSNNLDEFFRVRVAILKRIAQLDKGVDLEGGNPSVTLKEIHSIVRQQSKQFEKIYKNIIKDLAKHNVHLIDENQLSEKQGEFVKQYFETTVRPQLMPLIITKGRELPDLLDDAIYLAVHLKHNSLDKDTYALIDVPTNALGRFIQLPTDGKNKYLMLLDDVIRYELKELFFMFEFDEINAYTIKLTRDAELDIDDDVSQSYVKKIVRGLEKRKEANPVRFVHDEDIPQELLSLLLEKLNFSSDDAVIKGGRYHNFKDFVNFPKIGTPSMMYEALQPLPHKDLKKGVSVFSIIKKKDLLLHFPYHSFYHFIDYLREASIDPHVKEIKITVYRVAKKSNVMKALINAARNGKKVVVVMELQARFDEQANIKWTNKMREEGVKVIFGVPGLKVHSKVCFVSRKEDGKIVNYGCLGTGNFNEDSSNIFSDHLIMTSHKGITSELNSLFDFFDKNYKIPEFKNLWASPFHLRKEFVKLVEKEIRDAQHGKPAFIYIKLNNLVDTDIIELLCRAKTAGVDVRLNIRGMFSLFPEFDNPENAIPSIALIDQFLEHSRIYIFGGNGNPKVYISSADMMTRNLDRRIEVACPINDVHLRKELIDMFNIQWKDNTAARILNNKLDNQLKERKEGEPIFRSQFEFYEYLKNIHVE